MANVGARAVTDHLETLLRCGTCAGQSDQELLDRFTAIQDEADVAEATWHRMQAEFGLKTTQARTSDIDLLLRRLSEFERKVDQLQKERLEKTFTRP